MMTFLLIGMISSLLGAEVYHKSNEIDRLNKIISTKDCENTEFSVYQDGELQTVYRCK